MRCNVADELGVDELHAEVLPEDKAAYVKQAKAEGYTCYDGGDGINDSPAISEAHVGIAMNEGVLQLLKNCNVTIFFRSSTSSCRFTPHFYGLDETYESQNYTMALLVFNGALEVVTYRHSCR